VKRAVVIVCVACVIALGWVLAGRLPLDLSLNWVSNAPGDMH